VKETADATKTQNHNDRSGRCRRFRQYAFAQNTPGASIPSLQIFLSDRLNVFNKAWETVNKHFFDPKFNGADWPQMKVKYKPLVEAPTDKAQLRDVLQKMVSELHVSHTGVNGFSRGVNYNYGVDLTQIEGKWLVRATGQDSAAQRAGVERGWLLMGVEGDCVGTERKADILRATCSARLRSPLFLSELFDCIASERPNQAVFLTRCWKLTYEMSRAVPSSLSDWFSVVPVHLNPS
jgi:hypothetical protein